MKTILTSLLLATAAMFNVSCNGQTVLEQAKTVRACSPDMGNMEMLSMTQPPGWSLLAGTQWTGNSYTNSIKGVNDKLGAAFFIDMNRPYMQTPMFKSGTTDGKTVYLDLMSAADYLDFVFRRQFSHVANAKRTQLKTLGQYSEAERQQLEQQRQATYNSTVNYLAQSSGGSFTRVVKQTADRALAEYKWVQDGDTIVHSMEVIIGASFQEIRSAYLNTTQILWSQNTLWTATAPAKNIKQMEKDFAQMIPTIKFNDQYIAALNNRVREGMQRNEAETRRIQNEMAVAEVRHQQNMARQIMETQEYVANARREVNANRQASMERINQGWTDAIKGVDRYVGTDGKVVEVPVSMGSKVWQSAEGGTIYTSDSYLFSPVANLPDKDGIVREFRQLQLLK
ncbi:hypothetical protein FACS189438_1850 [Bacteroidia bacterium]|nr:hypothetical protein FACS189438_1850 [Bacteroidia bacterium]